MSVLIHGCGKGKNLQETCVNCLHSLKNGGLQKKSDFLRVISEFFRIKIHKPTKVLIRKYDE
jgi:hypothetical protein